jgi:hypothetical protein
MCIFIAKYNSWSFDGAQLCPLSMIGNTEHPILFYLEIKHSTLDCSYFFTVSLFFLCEFSKGIWLYCRTRNHNNDILIQSLAARAFKPTPFPTSLFCLRSSYSCAPTLPVFPIAGVNASMDNAPNCSIKWEQGNLMLFVDFVQSASLTIALHLVRCRIRYSD